MPKPSAKATRKRRQVADEKTQADPALKQEISRLQTELCKLQDWVVHKKLRVVIIFEGRDGAGKGGMIRTITERVSPRVFRVVALPAPTERERTQVYIGRYLPHLPAEGEVVIFDRSWYNRAGVEYVMGFCTEEQHSRFLKLTPQIEKQIVDDGIILIKYWLEVSPEEQARRFAARLTDKRRQWKLSALDLPSRAKWFEYSRARDVMLEATDLKRTPWHIVRSDDKTMARIHCIRHLLSMIPYKPVRRPRLKMPRRSRKFAYDDQAALKGRTFVPEKWPDKD
jgi:polyphosphate kinase 2